MIKVVKQKMLHGTMGDFLLTMFSEPERVPAWAAGLGHYSVVLAEVLGNKLEGCWAPGRYCRCQVGAWFDGFLTADKVDDVFAQCYENASRWCCLQVKEGAVLVLDISTKHAAARNKRVAADLVAKAREEASALLLKAREEAAEIIVKAKLSARKQAEEILGSAKDTALDAVEGIELEAAINTTLAALAIERKVNSETRAKLVAAARPKSRPGPKVKKGKQALAELKGETPCTAS